MLPQEEIERLLQALDDEHVIPHPSPLSHTEIDNLLQTLCDKDPESIINPEQEKSEPDPIKKRGLRAFSDDSYKYYRLTKPIGNLQPGAIFVHDPYDHLYGSISDGCLKLCWMPNGDCYSRLGGGTIILHTSFLDTDWFEPAVKLGEKSGRWKPLVDDVYYYITNDGIIVDTEYYGGTAEHDRYDLGNMYPTREAAEFEIERRKVLAEIQEFTLELPRNEKELYGIYYRKDKDEVSVFNVHFNNCYGIPVFQREQAQACIDTIGKDRLKKYYFRV